MKHLPIILILCLPIAVQAQSSRIKTQISGDNQTLSIRIEGHKQGHDIYYQQAFDVSVMNGLQVDLLKYRVFASQGVALPISEMKRLSSVIFVGVILIGLVIAGLILRYQSSKGIGPNSGKRLQIT